MSNELIDWSGFRNSMEYAARGFTKTKEAMANVMRAFESLQTAFQGEFPCIIAIMVEGTDVWASSLVAIGTVRVTMNADRLAINLVQNDDTVPFVIKDEFTEPVHVQVVLLEPDTHEIAHRFDETFKLSAGDTIWIVDGTDVRVRR